MTLLGENGSIQKINRPIVTLSTTNSTWPEMGSNPGFHCNRHFVYCRTRWKEDQESWGDTVYYFFSFLGLFNDAFNGTDY